MPRAVPDRPEPWEIDLDPAPLVAAVHCPVLLVYGDDDRWVPIEDSLRVFQRLSDVELVRVPGGGHAPTVDGEVEGTIIPFYHQRLIEWIERRVLNIES